MDFDTYTENPDRKYYSCCRRNTSGAVFGVRFGAVAVMAAHSNNFIRVRLYFDYPPPAVIDCRMCWLLVDLNTCRVVADLESIIREKFEFSRRSILNLFIEDCYLPHTESIYVVRDNDSVRVKVDCLAQVNGHSSCPDTASENCRKRQRPTEEDVPGENGVGVELKKKKRKKRSEESLERDAKQASADERIKKSQGKCTEKKKRKEAKENGPTLTPKPAPSAKKIPASVDQPVKSTKKPPVAQAKTQNVSSSDSSSSSSEEDEASKKPAAQKSAPKTLSSTPAASKVPPNTKPAQTKSHPPSASSSETVSSSDEATSVKSPSKNKPLTSTTSKGRISDKSKSQQAPPALQSTNCAQKQAASVTLPSHDKITAPCDSDSEEEIELVIRRPVQQPVRGVGSQSSWRGRGRGKTSRGDPGTWGRGEGRGGTRGCSDSFEFSYNGAKEPSHQTDSLTNMSVVLQNEAESAPKQDYSSMPLLAAPPQVGQKIAFKLLELTENYTPEVSEYREGKIVSFDPTTKQVELELINAFQARVEPGKFDLVYQNPDGSERVEYAVYRGSRVTEGWECLLEPRLII
ncbi:coilin [Siniperca chuatsi]|uniref:coilin n=1 Tax=Siniperca chuatsi TaxID=119488 RepID=UPI001CE14832|nr:coilin [Siniperca chuatsi]